MDYISVILIAFALSFDSFAAAVSCGLSCKKISLNQKLFIPLSFSVFQAGMPLIGYFAGKAMLQYIRSWDHWLAFVLLLLIGVHMILGALKEKNGTKASKDITWRLILGMSVATSIDALATGFSLGLLEVHILVAILSIFIVTYLASIGGMFIGKRFSTARISHWAEIAGGIILIGIGMKVAISHMLDHGLLS